MLLSRPWGKVFILHGDSYFLLVFSSTCKSKCPSFQPPEQLNTVLIGKIKRLSQRRNCSLENPAHLRAETETWRWQFILATGWVCWSHVAFHSREHLQARVARKPSGFGKRRHGRSLNIQLQRWSWGQLCHVPAPSSSCSLSLGWHPRSLLQVSSAYQMLFPEALPDSLKSDQPLSHSHPHSNSQSVTPSYHWSRGPSVADLSFYLFQFIMLFYGPIRVSGNMLSITPPPNINNIISNIMSVYYGQTL